MCRSRRSSCVPTADSWGRFITALLNFQPFQLECFPNVHKGAVCLRDCSKEKLVHLLSMQGCTDVTTPAVAIGPTFLCKGPVMKSVGSKLSGCTENLPDCFLLMWTCRNKSCCLWYSWMVPSRIRLDCKALCTNPHVLSLVHLKKQITLRKCFRLNSVPSPSSCYDLTLV